MPVGRQDDATPDSASAPAAAPAAAPEGFTEGPFDGSVLPADDGSGPEGWIKGNADSMVFHGPGSPGYEATEAEVWFASEDAARGAGFQHWDAGRR
ncbi:sunset domain-containing protein [Barrientosiimonas endolithica]|uniref:Uncharacterized protein n=1 Tax=Barrientosiimonas endolithica TaxID=1535208 RepID=A0ABM8HEV8_9MICO|nr:hypothetical protein [Barrientosiimonas endolithica]BDZ59550.1 hypothetical protein GCM10025872_32070 [Barrientosiimonas endolithica]